MHPNDAPHRILVVNANWVGDALFSTPALRALKKKYPAATIACLGPSRIKPVLARNPRLNEFIVYDDRVSLLSLPEFFRVVSVLRRGRFDRAIFFHRSKTKVLLAKLAGIRERIGYSAPGRDGLLTRAIEPPSKPVHKIDYFLGLLEKAGVPSDGRHMEFDLDPSARPALDALLSWNGLVAGERYAVVHAGGNWALKRWSVAHFIESIRAFTHDLGLKVVLCGTASEQAVADEILSHFPEHRVISLCGRTSFDGLAHLIKGAAFLLSNDSGPIHLAASLGTKIVGVFGPTSPALTGPVSLAPMRILSKDVGCAIPCYFQDCSYRVCMDWLEPREVVEAAKELLHA